MMSSSSLYIRFSNCYNRIKRSKVENENMFKKLFSFSQNDHFLRFLFLFMHAGYLYVSDIPNVPVIEVFTDLIAKSNSRRFLWMNYSPKYFLCIVCNATPQCSLTITSHENTFVKTRVSIYLRKEKFSGVNFLLLFT